MGHVDHGKTTLLDYIKKTQIAAREAGGITQAIGAYEIVHAGKKMTFIDTPGHEAFSHMRTRGASVADLAILVVAADDGVQPQTKESIETLMSTNTPFVVAINKIDKANADVEKSKASLMQHGVYLEGAGGNISWQQISAKNGTGVDELLDLLSLAAEMEGFTYDPNADAEGIILEAKLDKQRGIIATGIVKNGTLKTGKNIMTKSASGKIKLLEDFLGKRTAKLEPSSPVMIMGFETLPKVGEEFVSGDIELAIREKTAGALTIPPTMQKSLMKETGNPELRLILKADVSGSLEAFSSIVKSINQKKVNIRIMGESVGEISDSDVKAATSGDAVIIGFNAKVSKSAEQMAQIKKIRIITGNIIYKLVETIEEEIKAIEEPAPLGIAEIMATYSQKGKKQVIGGKITNGIIKNNSILTVTREGEVLGTGKLTNLQTSKRDVTQVEFPMEFGMVFETTVDINVGDLLSHEVQKRTAQ
jgi:translation initiation factor IF-2